MKKVLFLLITLMSFLWLSACGASPDVENKFYTVDERAVTEFLELEITETAAYDNYNGVHAQRGYQLVVVDLTIWNTQSYTLPMSRYDFRLQWDEDGEDYVYPLAWYCPAQLPDQYEIPQGEKQQGKLVFQVSKEEKDLALGFLEIYENDSQGDAHFIYFTV